jgi:pyruvate ferredoxin oxidoreductase alpha subunit
MRAALCKAKRVVVLEKCLAVGIGGIVSEGVRRSLSGIQLKGYTVIAGLGGRAVTKHSLLNLFGRALRDELEELNFLDLDWDIVNRELARGKQQRRAGPTAENILRDLGQAAVRIA